MASEASPGHTWLRVQRRTGPLIVDTDGKSRKALVPGLWHVEWRPDGKPFAVTQTLCGRQPGKFRPQRSDNAETGDSCQECLRLAYPGDGKPVRPKPYRRRK